MEDLDPRRPELPGVEEGGHDGSAAAHDVVAGLDLADERLGLGFADEVHRRGVDRGRLGLGQEMGEVCRGDDEDLLPGAGLGQGRGHRLDRPPRLEAHDDGDDLGPGQGPLDEGDLDLDRMLLDLGPGVVVSLRDVIEPGGLGQGPGQGLVDRDDAERCREAGARVDRTPRKGGMVGGADDDDGLEGHPLDEGVRVGRGRPGIDVAGVRDDDGPDLPRRRRGRLGVGEEEVDLGGEPDGVLLVEQAGDAGRPDVLRRGRELRREEDRRESG